MYNRNLLFSALLFILPVLESGCSDSTDTTVLTSIEVVPDSETILMGSSQQFTAIGNYGDGSAKDLTLYASWDSLDTDVATISDGLATTIDAGTTSITATLDGISGSATLQVTSQSGETPSNTIGYVGCSLTLGAVDVYETLGGTKFWPDEDLKASYPGGSVFAWYENLIYGSSLNNRWNTFEALLSKYTNTNKIWWHVCPRPINSDTDLIPTYEETLAVLNRIKQDTDMEIYVSVTPPMPFNVTSDYDTLSRYMEIMTAEGLVNKGPVLTELTEAQVGIDGHPNKEGNQIWGGNLHDFFDTLP